MANELQTTLEAILADKNANLLATNLKKDVTCLGVTGTYTGTTINNQDKTVTENGTVTADDGYTGLGTVTVNVSGTSGPITQEEYDTAVATAKSILGEE